jgi:hypothetical protein
MTKKKFLSLSQSNIIIGQLNLTLKARSPIPNSLYNMAKDFANDDTNYPRRLVHALFAKLSKKLPTNLDDFGLKCIIDPWNNIIVTYLIDSLSQTRFTYHIYFYADELVLLTPYGEKCVNFNLRI